MGRRTCVVPSHCYFDPNRPNRPNRPNSGYVLAAHLCIPKRAAREGPPLVWRSDKYLGT
jgi:hypothetical protein